MTTKLEPPCPYRGERRGEVRSGCRSRVRADVYICELPKEVGKPGVHCVLEPQAEVDIPSCRACPARMMGERKREREEAVRVPKEEEPKPAPRKKTLLGREAGGLPRPAPEPSE